MGQRESIIAPCKLIISLCRNRICEDRKANPGAGISTTGDTTSGNIYATDANGNKIFAGSYQWVAPKEAGAIDDTDNVITALSAPFIARDLYVLGRIGFEAWASRGAIQTLGIAGETGDAVVAAGAKSAVRDAIENGPFNSAVKSNLKRQLQAIGNNATITIEKLPNGSARLSWARPGFEGSQKFVKLIDSSGRTINLTQYGYDATGNQVHVDRKF